MSDAHMRFRLRVEIPRETWDQLPASVVDPKAVWLEASPLSVCLHYRHRPPRADGAPRDRDVYDLFAIDEEWLDALLPSALSAEAAVMHKIVRDLLPDRLTQTVRRRDRARRLLAGDGQSPGGER